MNRLLKYIIIVNLIFVVLYGLVILGEYLYELNPVIGGPFTLINRVLDRLSYYLLPIFIVLISAIYQFKNPDFKGYFESLLIPFSYIFLAFVVTFATIPHYGEQALSLPYYWFQFVITFVAVLTINLIICLVKHTSK